MPKEYNGYYDYNVWNVMLYVDNEESIYNRKIAVFDQYYKKAISYKQFMRGINQVGAMAKMKSDVKREKLSETEIEEIRKVIREQYREYEEYRNKHGSY